MVNKLAGANGQNLSSLGHYYTPLYLRFDSDLGSAHKVREYPRDQDAGETD